MAALRYHQHAAATPHRWHAQRAYKEDFVQLIIHEAVLRLEPSRAEHTGREDGYSGALPAGLGIYANGKLGKVSRCRAVAPRPEAPASRITAASPRRGNLTATRVGSGGQTRSQADTPRPPKPRRPAGPAKLILMRGPQRIHLSPERSRSAPAWGPAPPPRAHARMLSR